MGGGVGAGRGEGRARRERERALDFTSDNLRPDVGTPRLDPIPCLPAGHID